MEMLKKIGDAPAKVVPALGSKKFVGAGSAIALILNLDVPGLQKMWGIVAIAGAYIIGQAIADIGKEKVKAENAK